LHFSSAGELRVVVVCASASIEEWVGVAAGACAGELAGNIVGTQFVESVRAAFGAYFGGLGHVFVLIATS
jgi:hypothetical protein